MILNSLREDTLMIDRKQIKAAAKARMAQSAPSYWKIMLVWMVAAAVVPQLVQNLTGDSTESMQKLSQLLEGGIDPDLALRALQLSAGQLTAAWALSLALNIFQMVMGFGLTVYCLRLYRGQECGTPDLFTGFTMVGRVIGQQVLIYLIALGLVILFTIPVTFIAIFAAGMGEVLGGILLIAVSLGALFLIALVMLSYGLATIALADQPELGAMGSIQYGKNVIRGNKGRYVVFVLSFFGWMLLCALPSGIFSGVYTAFSLPIPLWAANLINAALMLPFYLWLMPYIQTSISGLYDALRQENGLFPQMPPL